MITYKFPDAPAAPVSISGTIVNVAGVSVDCEAEQRDWAVTIEIRGSLREPHVGGDGPYLAIIRIPPKRYDEFEEEVLPIPLDMDAVEIELWPVEER